MSARRGDPPAAWRARLERRVLAPLARTGWRYRLWILFLVAVVAWAVFAYSRQLGRGLIVTGMRDRISWGLYIASFVFFIGISHAGTLLSAILRVSRATWQMSITRMAEFITVVALLVAGLFPFIDLGRPDRVFNLVRFGRWQSPLLWDIFAITTYLTGSLIYLLIPLVPDFALCRDRLGQEAPRWKRRFFRAAAVGWEGSPGQQWRLHRAMKIMAVLIIPIAVSVHTVVSWIFAMTLRVPFNSTVFGAYFVAGAIYSGIAAIILLMAVLRRVLHLEEYITRTQFVNLGYLLAALSGVMMYFNLSEYVTSGYKMEAGVAFQFRQLMTGSFAPLFWLYAFGGLLAPALVILFRRTRTIPGIITASVLVVVTMWIERYFLVVSGFRVPLMPYAPASYAPTWIEWSVLAGAFALFALIVSVVVKLLPVVSVWEVTEQEEWERPAEVVQERGWAPAAVSPSSGGEP
ncbi:MAG: polysulfide reductase NrfD [Acidobacteria bacterium]|nr:polysulfide reductase NrfD [Acidobacteriota bacterium]